MGHEQVQRSPGSKKVGGRGTRNRCMALVRSGVKGSGKAGSGFRVHHKGWGSAGSGSQPGLGPTARFELESPTGVMGSEPGHCLNGPVFELGVTFLALSQLLSIKTQGKAALIYSGGTLPAV